MKRQETRAPKFHTNTGISFKLPPTHQITDRTLAIMKMSYALKSKNVRSSIEQGHQANGTTRPTEQDWTRPYRLGMVTQSAGVKLEELLSSIKGDISNTPRPDYFAGLEQDSPDWHTLRNSHLKLSGSEFGAALGIDDSTSRQLLYKKKRTPELVAPPSEYTQKILDWGKTNEANALAEFRKYFCREMDWFPWQISQTGTWVFREDPRVGSTPDALVFDDEGILEAVVEIKCPYKQDIYPSLLLDKPLLKNNHYVQVLMEMRATNVETAYYICWSPRKMVVAEVPYNEALADEVFMRAWMFMDTYLRPENAPAPPRMASGERHRLEQKLNEGQNIRRVTEIVFFGPDEGNFRVLYK